MRWNPSPQIKVREESWISDVTKGVGEGHRKLCLVQWRNKKGEKRNGQVRRKHKCEF